MRQILFYLNMSQPWSGWQSAPNDWPSLGACWVLLALGLGYILYHLIRRHPDIYRSPATWIQLGIGLLVVSIAGTLGFLPDKVPIFGYGVMVLIGFTAALTFACLRAKAVGINPEVIMDSAFWILISGVGGGRLAYLIQYRDSVFQEGDSLGETLFNVINLSEGGLVLIGAFVGGGIGVVTYFWFRKLNPLEFCDLLMPAVFIGVGFGRIGCLLNGCCFGDRCELPWGIQFPAGSVPFNVLVARGFLTPDVPATFPLHPTQIYSSLDGFVLALVTAIFYWYRKHPGDVLALGCMLYSITRFLMEFLRADEMGQLGTGLTISQLYSIGIFLMGLILLLTGPLRGAARIPATPIQQPT